MAHIPLCFRLFLLIGLSLALPFLEHNDGADEDAIEIIAHPGPEEDENGEDFVPTHQYFKLPLSDDADTVEIIADNSAPEEEEDSEDYVPTHPYFKLPLHDEVAIKVKNGLAPAGEGEEAVDFQKYFKSVSELVAKAPSKPSEESGEILATWTPESGVNPEEVGKYLEGDIVSPKNSASRNGLTALSARWPGAVIPYVIDRSFSSQDLSMIQAAFNQYQTNTCIKFVRRKRELDYIKLTKQNTGCWSSVGRIGGMQEVNLQSPGCLTKIGTVIHELMHTAGFLHEQNRWERDDYVTIFWQNIESGREYNFDKAPQNMTDGFGVEYDYGSVMHYTMYAFTKNNLPTIVPKQSGVTIGQREGFSAGDIAKLRKMYGCV